MKEKLNEILDSLENIGNKTGEGMLTFLLLISMCVTCNYTREINNKLERTNKYLGKDYYHEMQQDTLSDTEREEQGEGEDENPTHNKTKKQI